MRTVRPAPVSPIILRAVLAGPKNHFSTPVRARRPLRRPWIVRLAAGLLGLALVGCGACDCQATLCDLDTQPADTEILTLHAADNFLLVVCEKADQFTSLNKDGITDYSDPKTGLSFDGEPIVFCEDPNETPTDGSIPLVRGAFESAPGKIAIPESDSDRAAFQLAAIIRSYYNPR